MSPLPETRLFSALLRQARKFRQEHIPLTGIVGTDIVFYSSNPPTELARLLRSPPPSHSSLSDGLHLLPLLQQQLTSLQAADQPSRKLLTEWNDLITRTRTTMSSSAFTPAIVAEASLSMISAQAQTIMTQFKEESLFDKDNDNRNSDDDLLNPQRYNNNDEEEEDNRPPLNMDALGTSLAYRFSEGGNASACLAALSDILYTRERLKYEPYEWVYDGLAPIVLEDILRRRKGAPIALAIIAAGIAKRAGLPLVPVPALTSIDNSSNSLATTAEAAAAVADLPPSLSYKLSGGSQASGPTPSHWLLALSPPIMSASPNTWIAPPEAFLDSSNGKILSLDQVEATYPGTLNFLKLSSSSLEKERGERGGATPSLAWRQIAMMELWRELIKTVVQAHQRRGESDIVAQWYYVLLALDTGAPEWGHMLAGPEVT